MTRWIAALLGLVACESAPDVPTYRRDVKPILEANCVRCHGAVSRGGAPDGFRLDRYSASGTDDGRFRIGAGSGISGFAAARTHAKTMPPVTPLSDRQIEILGRWGVLGEAFAERGDPDPDNQLPALERIDTAVDDEVLTLEYRISDPDFQVVTGDLLATPMDGGADIAISADLYSGRNTARWDMAVVAEGNYLLRAELDDGHQRRLIELGEFAVAHPGGNAAPAPELCNVRRTEVIREGFALELAATDDGAAVSFEVFAERDGESIRLGSQTLIPPRACRDPDPPATLILGDLSGLESGGLYRFRAVATDDQGRRRERRSLPFVAGTVEADTVYDDVQPIFLRRCAPCHKPEPLAPAGGGAFDRYDGAESLSNSIYRRVVLEQTMPPRSAPLVVEGGYEPMTAAERQQIAAWLLGGYPRD